MDNIRQMLGKEGEHAVYFNLKHHFGFFNVAWTPYAQVDFLVLGLKIELKTARPKKNQKSVAWSVNFHRHGKMQSPPDYYLIRLMEVPGMKRCLHLLLDGKAQKKKTRHFSIKTLLSGDFEYANRYRNFCKKIGEFEFLRKRRTDADMSLRSRSKLAS